MTKLVVIGVLLSGVVAHAGQQVLTTAPVMIGQGGFLTCNITNASPTKTITVEIEGLPSNGPMGEGGESSPLITLGPGFAAGFKSPTGAYCQFVVNGGSKKDVRAAAIYMNLNGSNQGIVLPAQ